MRVFLCTLTKKQYTRSSSPRTMMYHLCWSRWTAEISTNTSIWPLRPDPTELHQDFQRHRRMKAELVAPQWRWPFYVLADDDCLLMPAIDGKRGEILKRAEIIMAQHPTFGMISFLPDNHDIYPWTPEGYTPHVDEDVREHVSVGGIRVIRRGIIKEFDWPPMTGPGYDKEHCELMRAKGYRVGYFRNLWMTHLGKGWSSVWPSQTLTSS